jgi:hypothetical protein
VIKSAFHNGLVGLFVARAQCHFDACDLIELGVIGMTLEAILFISFGWTLMVNWWRSVPDRLAMQGGIAAAWLVFMFAMTNVSIFSAQLKCLFWALVAIGSKPSMIGADQTVGRGIPFKS